MASGEHVVEDLFGFAELTGETFKPASESTIKTDFIVDKKAGDSHKFIFEKEKIKRDTDEVVIPIFFEKSGVKKYKVLARHQVEDDEDIRRPSSLERESPNSEEQRKENINIDKKNEKVQKQKPDMTGNIKRPKVKRIEKRKEHSIKSFKISSDAKNFKKGKLKIQGKKVDEKGDKDVEQEAKKAEILISKDPRAKNYEFHDDSDSNTELHKGKTKVCDSVNYERVETCNSSVQKIEETCKTIDKNHPEKNPLRTECRVKLRRDPSIENYYKTKSESDSKESCDSSFSYSDSETDDKNVNVNDELCDKQTNAEECKDICRQNSSEDSSMKTANMVYNVDIQVRKSGRLRSAKCASRYRGDYGIRVDTYKQLLGKTGPTFSKTEESGSYESEFYDNRNTSEQSEVEFIVKEGITDTAVEKVLENDRNEPNNSETLRSEGYLNFANTFNLEREKEKSKEDIVTCDDSANIPNETCTVENNSEEFTVLKEPNAANCDCDEERISNIEQCANTKVLIEKCLEHNNDKVISQQASAVEKLETDKNLLNCNTNSGKNVKENAVHVCNDEVDGLPMKECLIEENSKPLQNISRQTGNETLVSAVECDNSFLKNESFKETCEVPCSNMIAGNPPCAVDGTLEKNMAKSVRNASSQSNNNAFQPETSSSVSASKDLETKTEKLSESQVIKEKTSETVSLQQNRAKSSGKEYTGYVHSVGKSVNKMQKRIKTKKIVSNISPEQTEIEISSELSPVKDPALVLETLRQKLFESAGADVVEADKVPKQFESKLISSKQRQNVANKSSEILDLNEKDMQLRDSDAASGRSGKSTPRCSTPKQESSTEILEEVAQSLNVLHQAKRRSEHSGKVRNLKRQRFEEKTFLLRSRFKKSDDDDGTESPKMLQNMEIKVNKDSENVISAGRIAERTSRSSCESSSSKSGTSKTKSKSNTDFSDKKDSEQEKPVPKPKAVKCSACSHIFKTKELLRKHFPCRIRQTRTWSQNKLRPNRAVKRIESGSKMFVCRLPKVCKPEPSKPRPQLLTYRKTKFRRVKGKRRRKLYQLIQDLRQRRKPVKWPHLSIVFDDLSFKEQCLYKLGMICIGHASEGLERYTAEDITVFEQHRAKEKWLTEDAQNFEHSIPDNLEAETDINISTELSTDNQESDFFSPRHVINFPQENIQNINCDAENIEQKECLEDTLQEASVVEINENDRKEVSCYPSFISDDKDSSEGKLLHDTLYPAVTETETETSYEDVLELSYQLPEKRNANISVQEYLEFFRSSKTNNDSDSIVLDDIVNSCVETSPRSQTVAQLETLTSVEEITRCFEETQVLAKDTDTVISIQGIKVGSQLETADISEIDVKTTNHEHEYQTNTTEFSENSREGQVSGVSHQMPPNDMDLKEENETNPENEVLVNNEITMSCGQKSNKDESDFELNGTEMEYEESTVQKSSPLGFPADHVISSDKQESVPSDSEKDSRKTVPANVLKQTTGKVMKTTEGILDSSTGNVGNKEEVKKLSPKKKFSVAPDIELFHQTATIDDEILTDTPVTVKNGSEKEISVIQSPGIRNVEKFKEGDINTTIKSGFDSNPDLILQASDILHGILDDVEQTVNDKKVEVGSNETHFHLTEVEKPVTSSAGGNVSYLKSSAGSPIGTTADSNLSPVKGILKNVSPKGPHNALSPLKSNTGLSNVEIKEKSHLKKKIDFKTYAKRKGMLKEKDNDKETMHFEPLHVSVDIDPSGGEIEKDENEKECMRSESQHEIEDDLLGRLLDAVNVIDSIIEEHKDPLEPETEGDSFSAITPEMAFQAAISNKSVSITNTDTVGKLYDIESIFPYSEVEKASHAEKSHFTEITDLSVNNDNFYQEPASNDGQVAEKSSDISVHIGNDEINEPTGGKIDIIEAQVIPKAESPKSFKDQFSLTTNKLPIEIIAAETVEKSSGSTNGNYDEHKSEDSFEDSDENSKVKEMTEKELGAEVIFADKIECSANNAEFFERVGQEKEEVNCNNFIETFNVRNKDTEEHVHEALYIENQDEHDDSQIMKSPEHIPKKRKNVADKTASIKESKRDFTIKYELNGIVVKEDLLTGDKNVVENSSPFRSSVESDSNCDQSSVSELDVSSVLDNETSFDSTLTAAQNDDAENIRSFTGKIENKVLSSNSSDNRIEIEVSLEDSCSSEKILRDKKQGMETDVEILEDAESVLSLEGSHRSEMENKTELNFGKVELESDVQVALKDSKVTDENTTDLYTGEESILCDDNNEKEVSEENVPCLEVEPLLNADVQVLRKVSDDHSVGSPPVLEKVEVSENSADELVEEDSCQEIAVSVEGEPPILEPEQLEKDGNGHIKPDKHDTINSAKQERHFLDILTKAGKEENDQDTFPSFENSNRNLDMSQSKKAEKPLVEELYSEESTLNDSIGRHFSDVVSETAEAPKSPKSKLHLLFGKSEREEVTLAEIKDILSPRSKKTKSKSIPKESLLNIKAGIASLLSNMKKPLRKDPAWLKRNALSDCFKQKKIKKMRTKKRKTFTDPESSSDESISDQEEIVYISSDSSETTDVNISTDNLQSENQMQTKGSIADNILQMLDSLEDKGSVAENMSNLLDILAENLRYLGTGKTDELVEEISSDSDYSCSEETRLTNNSSTENSQKELIADYLEEGEQPPSLDDIPTARNFESCHIPDEIVGGNKEKFIEAEEPGQHFGFKDANLTKDLPYEKKVLNEKENLVYNFSEIFTGNKEISPKENVSVTDLLSKNTELEKGHGFKDRHSKLYDFEKSEGSPASTSTSDHTKDGTHKATTIFKSITELNSIETDDESNTEDSFDHVSMSARLSELKVLTKDSSVWEFNSDYNSDQELSDDFDLEIENDQESVLENSPNKGILPPKSNYSEGIEENSSLEIKDFHFQESRKQDREKTDTNIFKDESYISDVFLQKKVLCNISSTGNVICNEVNVGEKEAKNNRYIEETESDISFSIIETADNSHASLKPVINVDLDSENELIGKRNSLSGSDKPATKCLPEEIELTPSENLDAHNNSGKIKQVALLSNTEEDLQEGEINDSSESDEHMEDVDSISLRAVKDPESDNDAEITLSEDEDLRNDNCHKTIVEKQNTNINAADIYESAGMERNDRKVLNTTEKEIDFLEHDIKNVDQNVELKLIFEDLPKTEKQAETTKNGLIDLNADEDDNPNDNNGINFDDEDSSETVTYEEDDETISGLEINDYIENSPKGKACDPFKREENLTNSFLFQNKKHLEVNENIEDKRESKMNSTEVDKPSSVILPECKSQGETEELDLEDTDTFGNLPSFDTPEVGAEKDKDVTKRRSTSFNLDNEDFTPNFCESIAEKVKRKQRERSKSYCYNFNPWLYCSAAYVREVTKPAKKEISVFRSSILEKRAREKSFSPEKEDIECSSRKKRNSSVPKEAKLGNDNSNEESRSSLIKPNPVFQVKPCTVSIQKLTDDVINRYTNRKRKLEEDTPSEKRPPIKVTIKLSQIVYPPNSPYGSTSTSSDNYRSGYESCSEDSETDTNEQEEEREIETNKYEQATPNTCNDVLNNDSTVNDESISKKEIFNREPLKIKMRTLLTKMNSCEEERSAPKVIKEIDSVKSSSKIDSEKLISGSLNDLSNETNRIVSAGELIESEVLHDIKQECEKVKSKDEDVMFYLSESGDDEKEANVSQSDRQQVKKVEVEKSDNLKSRVLSKCSIKADCGESDVDLSDSDTDSEIQEEIDRILNSSSTVDFSSTIDQDDANDKNKTTMEQGRNSFMKMVLSNLRLSESESESDEENFADIEDSTVNEDKTCKELTLWYDRKLKGEQYDENKKEKVTETQSLNIIENNPGINTNGKDPMKICQFEEKDWTKLTKVGFKSDEQSKSGRSPSANESNVNQNKIYSQANACFDSYIDKSLINEEQDILPSVTDNEQPLDLTVPLKQNTIVTSFAKTHMNGLASKEVKEISGGEVEKKLPDEQSLPSEMQVIETTHTPEDRTLYDKPVVPSSPSKEEEEFHKNESLQLTESSMTETTVPNDVAQNLDQNVENTAVAKDTYDDILSRSLVDSVNEESLNSQVTPIKVVDSESVSYCEVIRPEKGIDEQTLVDDKQCNESTIVKTDDSENISKVVSENTCIPEEENKQLENDSAVKNLVEDVFHDVKPQQENTDEDMVYYAVELSDDFETNEAVVNLETVELIEGPIITENNDIHEENILDTNIIQSHVNDQFELGNEPLNEQIVETLNETKVSAEVRTSSSLESMTQIENQVFYPTVNNVDSKYLYGINEDSQSSNEVVEELVTEIVNDNTVMQDEDLITNENSQIFCEEQSFGSQNGKDRVTNDIPVHTEDSVTLSSVNVSDKDKILDKTPANNESLQVICENPDNMENLKDVTTLIDEQHVIEETDQSGSDMDTSISITIDNRIVNDSYDAENTSSIDCDITNDRDILSSPLNISENHTNTREMCSQQDSHIQLKEDNLSHGYDLLSNETNVMKSNDVDQNTICVESRDISDREISAAIDTEFSTVHDRMFSAEGDRRLSTEGDRGFSAENDRMFSAESDRGFSAEGDRLSTENEENGLVQGYDNCGMVIECNDENDYIITQNDNFDDDEDDDKDEGDDNEAMEIA